MSHRRRRSIAARSSPFIQDDNLYFWDYAGSDITVDATGTPSISDAPEYSRGTDYSFIQATKANQPLIHADGIEFTNGGGLSLTTATGGTPPLNGANDFYTSILLQIDATDVGNNDSIKIFDGISAARAGRLLLRNKNFAGNRFDTYVDEADGNLSVQRIAASVNTVKGNWYLMEFRHDIANDTIQYWQDGVEDGSAALANVFTGTAFPSTDSLGIKLGSTMFGIIRAMAVFDGAIPTETRQSISDYLLSLKP